MKRPRNAGSALVFSVMAVMIVSVLAAGFLQLALSVTRRLGSTSDTVQAMNLAEAGLAEAYTGLGVARSGNVASMEAPAVFGGGLLWVEAEEHANGLVELKCTAMYGTGRATLGLVCEPVGIGVAQLGFFTTEGLRLNPDVRLDSFDSSQGSYADQINTPLNNKGLVGTNGDMSLASGDLVFGDVVYGPTGKLDLAAGAIVTGGTSARPEMESLPPVEVPPIALAAPITHADGTPLIIPPGEAGYESLVIGKSSKLILKGPLTLVAGTLQLRLGAELVFDTSDGPVEIYITKELDFDTSSVVSTTTDVAGDSLIFVAAEDEKAVNFGAKSQFYGFIYGPQAEVHISAQYELYGGLVCKSLQLAAQGRMHADLALGATLSSQLPVMQAWRVVDIPHEVTVRRVDPFQVLGLDPTMLPSIGEAHQDQLLDVRFLDTAGLAGSYFGLESNFDWSLVKEVLYGVRDGEAFYLPEDYAAKEAVASDPMVDLVSSSMSSKELKDALLAEPFVSSKALVAASERDPPMSTSDLDAVLRANSPLSQEALLAAIRSGALDGSALTGILETNSPLDTTVLDAALNRIPPLTISEVTNLLSKQ